MFIVTDEILERLTCSQCKKYLSVKTIKVYPNRGIKCGRCSHAMDAGVVSLFGVLAEEALFRCVNRFEGCNQLLTYSDVAEHEISCIGKEYECPCCIESFKGTGYEIYVHFKEHHTDRLLINTPEFVLEIDNDLVKSYLYRKNDLLFYINAMFNRGEEELTLNVLYLGTDQDSSKISQMFSLHSLDGKLKYKSKRKYCCSVTGGNLKHFKINISPKDFYKDVFVCRFDIETENVENLVILPENFKKCKQDLEDKMASVNMIPSIFGKGVYPVTIFNPPSTYSQRLWTHQETSGRSGEEEETEMKLKKYFFKGVNPASTRPSFSAPITSVSLSQPDPITTVTSSIFGKSGETNLQSMITDLEVNTRPITTTVSSSIFGNSKPFGRTSSNRRVVVPTRFDVAPSLVSSEASFGKPSTSNGGRHPNQQFDSTLRGFPWTPAPATTFNDRDPKEIFSSSTQNGSNQSIFGKNQFPFGTPRTTGN